MTVDPTGEVPEEVLDLLRGAVRGDLLTGVEAVATGLLGAGWVRGESGGSWSCGADPAWTAHSSGRVPHVSVFTSGDHGDLLRRAAAVRELMGSGRAGPVLPGEPDPDWSTWTGGGAVVSLNVTPEHAWKDRPIPALLQLAVERAGPPDDGFPHDPAHDPARARHLAREGSPVARWNLAGEDDLPDDVVELLAGDDDPAVVAALAANEGHRRAVRDHR